MKGFRLFLLSGLLVATPAWPQVISPRFNDLMTAVLYQDPATVELLLNLLGKWPDKPDSQGRTPLAIAVMLGYPDSAEALLKAGADPDRAMAAARERGDPALLTLLERWRALRATSRRP